MRSSRFRAVVVIIGVVQIFADGTNSPFSLQAGMSSQVETEKIATLNTVTSAGQVPTFEDSTQPTPLPLINPNPSIPAGPSPSAIPEHLRQPAERVSGGGRLLPLSDPKVAQTPVVQAVQEAKDKLTVLWGQYMKVPTENSPTYQTYFNWAAELGPSRMGCLERYMACTDWCGTKGIEEKFPNCDPDQNGKQFIPGDPSECARPLNKLPQDPTQPWPGGSGC